jgi:hypothetical protein
VDGVRLAHFMVPVPGYMRALAANERLGGEPLRVEWMRVSPYAPAGRFTSRVLDAGSRVEWATATWAADVPEGTALAVGVRTGDTARPDATWSPWRPLRTPGGRLGPTSRFLQYRADLRTGDPARTPALRRMDVAYVPAAGSSSSSSVSGRATGFQCPGTRSGPTRSAPSGPAG